MNSDTKECPFCAETIKAKAKKCRFCGEWLDGHTRESVLRDYIGGDKVKKEGGVHFGEGDVEISGPLAGGDLEVQYGDKVSIEDGAKAEIKLGKEQRDEQYEIALNWEAKGKPRMRGFDLSGRDLSGLSLVKADLRGANLIKANLSGANLSGATLSGADLGRANLSEANLSGATLSGATLSGAILGLADLSEANLIWADLSEANLSGATLSGAILGWADLSEAKLNKANLSGARYNVQTKWPDGFNPKEYGAIDASLDFSYFFRDFRP